MLIYRFKITFENNDEFQRDIELATNQSFLDFYNIIADNLLLDKQVSSSFYLCDHKFRKKKAIYHPDHGFNASHKDVADTINNDNSLHLKMDECILSDFVDDPHQKFLFIYDLKLDWNFYIELIKIQHGTEHSIYPKVVRSVGKTPSELIRKQPVLPLESADEEAELQEFEEFEPDENEIEDIGYDPEADLLNQDSESGTLDTLDSENLEEEEYFDDTMENDPEFEENN